ncbi:MAG: cell division topological specificity factor MinE [Peptococcaceae bacterium]|nr:cell division topological specificity factor MinE [Peptococcaceae bacterium]
MIDCLNRVLGKAAPNSRIHARERLRLVLVHDRAKMSPYFMNKLKEDLYSVITRYVVADADKLEVVLNQSDRVDEL